MEQQSGLNHPRLEAALDSALDAAARQEQAAYREAYARVPPPVTRPSDYTAFSPSTARRIKRLLGELYSRENEALGLYEPLPHIDQQFHQRSEDIRLLRGSNRAGKTLGACAEIARAVTGRDPHGKYPLVDGIGIAVGLDETHCGKVMYENLFKPGAFWCIRDQASGRLRSFRPATDAGREAERVPSPPLIPMRFVKGGEKGISWSDKKKGIPRLVKFINGWRLYFFSSKAMPPQGWKIHLWWIDEECSNESWMQELPARVLDYHGVGFWSATPQVANPQLYDLSCRADEGDPRVHECVCLLSDNPHISEEAKRNLEADCANDEERRVRIRGEFRLTGFLVYPEFSMASHAYPGAGFQVPKEWCRWMIVDPGRQVCAVLFLAVPPPQADPFVLAYDELYITACDANKFGEGVAEKSAGGVSYEGFIIDGHAARVTEMGSGKTVKSQYSEALKTRGISSRATGHTFLNGSDDVKSGELAVRGWLRVRDSGTPKFRVLSGRLKKFEWEIARYHYKRIKQLVTDEVEKKNDHLMDCLRYIAARNPGYRRPEPSTKGPKPPAVRALESKRARRKKGDPGATIFLA